MSAQPRARIHSYILLLVVIATAGFFGLVTLAANASPPSSARSTDSAAAAATAPAVLNRLPLIAQPPMSQALRPLPAFGHIFVIVLENKETTSIIGNNQAPYINRLAQQYGLAAQFYGTTHPSLPNYLSIIGGDTFGVTTNCTDCFVDAPNLVDQLETAGKSWKGYMESMPKPCFVGDSGSLYRQKHNPFIYFDSVRTDPARCSKIVPFTELADDLAADTVPNFVFITPNMCNAMHDCSVQTGDDWLKTVVPDILASPAWQENGALFITFDEGKTNAGCCEYSAGGQIATLVVAPQGRPAFTSTQPYTHYSLLRTIEEAWGLPLLGHAACSCTTPMNEFFTQPVADTP